jgi:hypothetical protein
MAANTVHKAQGTCHAQAASSPDAHTQSGAMGVATPVRRMLVWDLAVICIEASAMRLGQQGHPEHNEP